MRPDSTTEVPEADGLHNGAAGFAATEEPCTPPPDQPWGAPKTK